MSNRYITESVIRGHHVSKDYYTSRHSSAEYYLVKKKVGMQLLQRSLFIGGEVFVTPMHDCGRFCLRYHLARDNYLLIPIDSYVLSCLQVMFPQKEVL